MTLDPKRLEFVLRGLIDALAGGDVLRDDLDHIDVGNELVEQPLKRDQRARHRRHRARHLDAVPLRKLRQRRHERGDVEFRQVHGAVFGDDHIQIGQQRRIVLRLGLGSGETQQTVGERRRILLGHREDHLLEHRSRGEVEPAGHAQVDEHDLPAGDDDVARVRVGVEETGVQHLRGVVVDELGADLLEVVARLDQLLRVGYGDAVNVVHDDHMLGAQLHVGLRAVHVPVRLAEAFEFAEVARLDQEVGLGFEGVPQLLDHAAQIHHLRAGHHFGRGLGDSAHDGHVLRHDLAHAGALHLHRHVLAGQQFGPVHLRQ